MESHDPVGAETFAAGAEAAPRACGRCAGCGRLGGVGAGERPWSDFVGVPVHCLIPKVMGMQRPRACPSCGGSGASSA